MWAADNIGRRPLMIWGAVGMAVCQLIVAAVGVAIPGDDLSGQKVLVAFSCIYIFFFATSWATLAWVVSDTYIFHIDDVADSCPDHVRNLPL
jgi:SP family sugar:H+ symporter-like MFS transporter